TCPTVLLSLYGKDMTEGLSEADQEKLGPLLQTIREEVADPDALALWDRYRHAARIYHALGRDRWEIAQIHHQAAWPVRDHAVGVVEGIDGPAAAREPLDVGAAQLERSLPAAQRKVLLFNLARIAHRGGYLAERDRMLAELDRLKDLTPTETGVRAALRH